MTTVYNDMLVLTLEIPLEDQDRCDVAEAVEGAVARKLKALAVNSEHFVTRVSG
jgi:hypothetical protein